MNKDGARDRGILTEADREYLRHPEEYSPQASYNREQAIQERVQRSLGDFPLLAKELDDSVFDALLAPERITAERDDGDTATSSRTSDATVALPYAVAFLIRASLATDRLEPFPEASVDAALSTFVRHTERGVEIWLNERHELTADVSVSVEANNIEPLDTLVDDLTDREEPLTGTDRIETVSQLSRAGYSTEEILELVGERPSDE